MRKRQYFFFKVSCAIPMMSFKLEVSYLEVITYRYVVRTAHSGYVCIVYATSWKIPKCVLR